MLSMNDSDIYPLATATILETSSPRSIDEAIEAATEEASNKSLLIQRLQHSISQAKRGLIRDLGERYVKR